LDEFSTDCVRFARSFFEEFGDRQISSQDEICYALPERIPEEHLLPYLRAITQRPECEVWFMDSYDLDPYGICYPHPLDEFDSLVVEILDRPDLYPYVIHPNLVVWDGYEIYRRF
jgi:hypothetical protein